MKIPTDFAKRLTRQTRERVRAGTTEAFFFVFVFFRYAKKNKTKLHLCASAYAIIEYSNLKAFMHHDPSVPGSSTPIITKVS